MNSESSPFPTPDLNADHATDEPKKSSVSLAERIGDFLDESTQDANHRVDS